jgi:hypothetical protein
MLAKLSRAMMIEVNSPKRELFSVVEEMKSKSSLLELLLTLFADRDLLSRDYFLPAAIFRLVFFCC